MEVFYWLLGQSRGTGIGHKDAVRLIDSTTIDLCKQQFEWASFRSGKSGVKIHTVYDPDAQTPTFFSITHAKKHDKKEAEKMPVNQRPILTPCQRPKLTPLKVPEIMLDW